MTTTRTTTRTARAAAAGTVVAIAMLSVLAAVTAQGVVAPSTFACAALAAWVAVAAGARRAPDASLGLLYGVVATSSWMLLGVMAQQAPTVVAGGSVAAVVATAGVGVLLVIGMLFGGVVGALHIRDAFAPEAAR
jgi:hypothetical protein